MAKLPLFNMAILSGEPPHPSALRVRYARSFSKRKEPRDHFWSNTIRRWFGLSISDRFFIGVIKFEGGSEEVPPATRAALTEADNG